MSYRYRHYSSCLCLFSSGSQDTFGRMCHHLLHRLFLPYDQLDRCTQLDCSEHSYTDSNSADWPGPELWNPAGGSG